jgi:hypothetical protein
MTGGRAGLGPLCLPPSGCRRKRGARRVLQGLIAIVATGDNKRGPLFERWAVSTSQPACRNLSHTTLE